jgi:phenylpropionate dioxygenase-like ring-hydroxylating dioxygenase large terminal subunit
VTLLGEHLAVYRDARGPVVLKDLCIHRGAALSLGWVGNGEITCAYHGWRYDRTGACVHIPSLPEGQAIPQRARVIAYPAEERYGLVWTVLDEPAAPIPAWPGVDWDDPEFSGFVAGTYSWAASAARATENFFDVTHLPWLHEGILGSRDQTVVDRANVTSPTATEQGFVYSYDFVEPDNEFGGGPAHIEYYVDFPYTAHMKRHKPNGLVSVGTQISSPVDDNHCRLYFLYVNNRPDEVSREALVRYTDVVLEQDKRIVESQRPEDIPSELREEMHLRIPDEASVAYRRLFERLED